MNKSSNGIDVLLFIFIVYSGFPALSVYLPSIVNVGVTVCMYAYVVVKLNKKFPSVFVRFLPLFAVDILYCIGSIIMNEGNFFHDVYGILRALLWPILAVILMQENNKKIARNTLLLTLIIYSITAITTIYGCSLYPGASRIITDTFQDESYRKFLQSFNIGDYQFVYAIALSIPLFIYFSKNRLLNPVAALLILALFYYTIYSTEFTTALIFSTLSLVLVFVPKSYGVKKIVILTCVLSVILSLSLDSLIILLQNVSEIVDSETMSIRFSQLSEGLSGQAVSDAADYSMRKDLWKISLDSFINNPLWGTYGKVGGHSLVLDTIGNFGLWGVLALIITFNSLYRLYVRPYAKYDIYMFASFMLLLTFVFSFFNTGVKFFVFSFIVPLTAFYYSKKSQ